ncbi:MAG: PLP-dependent aminotransferase family protein [Bacteroidetes bacterium]|nr:PLP-dependent aminotransferase family protein [Bacteroidota bacterium]
MAQILPFDRLIVIDRSGDTAVYLQIANAIVHQIRTGVLRRGSRLPGTRELSALLGVNRNTIKAALDELQAQGWIEALPRKGIFVAPDLPEVKVGRVGGFRGEGGLGIRRDGRAGLRENGNGGRGESGRAVDPGMAAGDKELAVPGGRELAMANFDLLYADEGVAPDRMRRPGNIFIDDGFPDSRLAPMDVFLRELRSLSGLPSFRQYMQYGSPLGTDYLINVLMTYLNDTRGLHIGKGSLMITRGVQMGTYLAANVLLRPGSQVVVGEPGYAYANKTFEKLGAVLNRVPVDEQGIDISAVERLCKKKKISLLYVMPHHHSPTTVRLSPQRRIQLLELARRYRIAIIEDDYDYDFHYDSNPVLPMASLDHFGNVIYVGTLSKTLVPAVRLGFMTGPEDFIQLAARRRAIIDFQGDAFMELAMAELFRNGTVGRHIHKSVRAYRQRRDHFCGLLESELGGRVEFRRPEGGMAVWAKWPGVDLVKLSELAAGKGLDISDGRFYNPPGRNYFAMRMGFASLDEREQERAVGILRECMKKIDQ